MSVYIGAGADSMHVTVSAGPNIALAANCCFVGNLMEHSSPPSSPQAPAHGAALHQGDAGGRVQGC